ncbi:MAG: hypothetical protein NW223_14090 [Hyphomicrobiaceae bacterium]|nr:hypothetical protein [Hyphomicrobiaceae bacterium]
MPLRILVLLHIAAAVVILSAATLRAQSDGAELAFMPATMTVTLLNDGGKYVAVDLKHIDKGGSCRMDADAMLVRVGAGSSPGSVRVRYIAPQLSSGGCPFLTEFELPQAEYDAARRAFLDRKADAGERVRQIRKDLGDKWDEVMGRKS